MNSACPHIRKQVQVLRKAYLDYLDTGTNMYPRPMKRDLFDAVKRDIPTYEDVILMINNLKFYDLVNNKTLKAGAEMVEILSKEKHNH